MSSRQLSLRLFIAALTFLAGVVIVGSWFVNRVPNRLEDPDCFRPQSYEEGVVKCMPPAEPVDYCEVVRKKDRYEGKIIRVRAVIVGYHHQHLYSYACGDSDSQSLVDYERRDAGANLINAIAALHDPEIEKGNIKAEVVVVGRFEAENKRRISDLMAWFGDEEMQRRLHPVEDKSLFTIMDVEQVRVYQR